MLCLICELRRLRTDCFDDLVQDSNLHQKTNKQNILKVTITQNIRYITSGIVI